MRSLRLPWCRLLQLPVLVLLLVLIGNVQVRAQEEPDGSAPFAFEVETLNQGLPKLERPLRLDTPRAALESFLDAIRHDDFVRAGHALNLDAIPEEDRVERAPEVALMLAFILRRFDLIDWTEIPDQPDARVLPGLQQSTSPYSRRSVELGEVELDGRPIPISLQRFRTDGGEPLWLFSPFAVERADEIFAEIRPRLIGAWIPLEQRLDTLGEPLLAEWVAAGLLILVAVLLGVFSHWLLRFLSKRISFIWAKAGRRVALPFSVLVAAVTVRVGLNNLILLTGPVASNLDIGSEMVMLASGAWLFIQSVSAGTLALSQRYIVPLTADDPENRRIKTTVYVMRRMALVFVALLSIGYIIHKVGVFESFALSLLASAGALSVIVAIAARPLLGNMVAGFQIALTDPVRIGDVVVYDGHWATVEDISFAHTVLRTWLDTRLIVPHSDFLSKSFENWSKEGEAVRRIVKVPVDYRIDVDGLRQKVEEILEGDSRSVDAPLVELVEADSETAVVWIWVTGTTAFTSWYLHNELREKLLRYLRDLDDGAYLPRRRQVLLRGEQGPQTGA